MLKRVKIHREEKGTYISGLWMGVADSSLRRIRMAFAVMMALAVFPHIAGGGDGDALPSSFEEIVCGYIFDLDELLMEFGLWEGDFGDDRLNRALLKACNHVEDAQSYALVPDLSASFKKLKGAMRELEKGAAVPVSGTGFADDLASLGSFYAENFIRDLIEQARIQEAVDAETLATAMTKFEEGVAARVKTEWEQSVSKFLQAVRVLEHELQIGPPCIPGEL